jgi:hypothetical protein
VRLAPAPQRTDIQGAQAQARGHALTLRRIGWNAPPHHTHMPHAAFAHFPERQRVFARRREARISPPHRSKVAIP